tara:strand:+ start:374 stop:664 length:291 start_codon:yes stop_codon:yes gene_type:complete
MDLTLRRLFKKTKKNSKVFTNKTSGIFNQIIDLRIRDLFLIIFLVSLAIFILYAAITIVSINLGTKTGFYFAIFFPFPVFLFIKWVKNKIRFIFKK